MIDYRAYVNMESFIFKGKTSDEVEFLLKPEYREKIRFKFMIDNVMNELTEIKDMLKNASLRIHMYLWS